jgi:hypothetical protein
MTRSKPWSVLWVTVGLEVLTLLVNAGVTWATDHSGPGGWILGQVATVVGGVAVAFLGRFGERLTEPSGAGPARGPDPAAHRSDLRAMAVLVGVVLIGIVVAIGVRDAVGYISGNEPGSPVLAGKASGRGAGMTLTVQEIEYTEHFTRVDVMVRNAGKTSASLPLLGNVVLSAEDGTTLQADPFRSTWSTTLSPGAVQRGTLVFAGHLPRDATRASLSVATVFRQGPGSGAATVAGIELDASTV